TYVQTLIDAGRITADEALVHPRRNLLMRAIDGVHPAEPDVSVREARPGDRFLVCSDGLFGYVADERIEELLGIADPTAVVTALVEAALEVGAPDNVTCVVADVVPVDEVRDAETPVVVGAAGEPRNRERLPGFEFPADAQIDPRSHAVVKVSTRSGDGTGGVGALAEVYAEERSGHRRPFPVRWLAVGIAVVLIVAAAIGITYAWARQQYYVGNDGGYVAIFRGLPTDIGPIGMHSVEQVTTLTVDSLPDFEAAQVESTIATESLAGAQQVVAQLTERAAQCATVPSTPGCPAAGTPSTTPTPTPSPSGSR
ncbi:MAG TPA: serine/threonine-protein phosphatase, partial [Candidatus Angelobacter sp.]|nr:serine/threonine-protein phosphatase [Candidatus Angelobacter sp.]